MASSVFHLADYIVFIGTIIISFLIGVFFAIWEKVRHHNTLEDYYLAGRKGKTLPVALSFVVSFQSSILMLGYPAESYVYGTNNIFFAVGAFVAFIIAAIVIVPVFHPLKLSTVYEYMYLRYGNNVLRYFTLTLGVVYAVFYMGSVTFGTSVAMEVVMGIPYWGTILIFTIVTTVYTSIGGIKAVIWTDVFQFLMMVAGFIFVISKVTIDLGGWMSMKELAGERFHFNFNPDPRIRLTFWTVSVGSVTQTLSMFYMQPTMQRIFSLPNQKNARIMFMFAGPVYCIIMVAAAIEGGVIFAYYASRGCDIYHGGITKNVNAIIPQAILDVFGNIPGLPGLFIAALSSAAFSTLSSLLSSLSVIIFQDAIRPYRPHMTKQFEAKLSRWLTVLFGVLALAVSFLISVFQGTISFIFQSFISCIDGPTCAIFTLSILFRRSTTKGVLIGSLCGMAVSMWLTLGKLFSDVPPDVMLKSGPVDQCVNVIHLNTTYMSYSNESLVFNVTQTYVNDPNEIRTTNILHEIYSLSYLLISLSAFLVTMVVGIVVSLCTSPPKNIDDRLLFSFRQQIWCKRTGQSDEKESQERCSEEMRSMISNGVVDRKSSFDR
ncbi:hypothetical protein DPMN_119997 [Dreissena polymorpha]|uniref:Sodium-dependent multivitamin transporter n=1 Tax=Dreissena polymorpha TaxID=45954 RepID=A0A9D4JPV2_DREPO|nr:hypothetical protein DPMN_119997 [Dreissena polymorpha]